MKKFSLIALIIIEHKSQAAAAIHRALSFSRLAINISSRSTDEGYYSNAEDSSEDK